MTLLPVILQTTLLLSTSAAQAANPVVLHEATRRPDLATREVAPYADVTPNKLDTVTMAELRDDGSAVAWPGELQPCKTDTTSPSAVRTAITVAEGHLNYDRTQEAIEMLKVAEEALGCLDSPAQPELATRIFYLRGILAVEGNTPPDAWAAFHQALVIDPTLTWDNSFSPGAGLDLFNSARASLESLEDGMLVAAPRDMADAVWIDGVALSPETPERRLPPGRHLVQAGSPTVSSYWLEITPRETTTLVLRGEFPDSAIAWAAQPERSMDLSALLASALGADTLVYILSVQAGLLSGTAGEDNFQAVRPAVKTPPVQTPQDESPVTTRKAPPQYNQSEASLDAPQLLTWSGAGIAALAGAWALQTKLSGNALYLECYNGNVLDPSACASIEQTYNEKRVRLVVANSLMVVGAATAGTGWYWGQGIGGSVRPWVSGRGIGLTLRK